ESVLRQSRMLWAYRYFASCGAPLLTSTSLGRRPAAEKIILLSPLEGPHGAEFQISISTLEGTQLELSKRRCRVRCFLVNRKGIRSYRELITFLIPPRPMAGSTACL